MADLSPLLEPPADAPASDWEDYLVALQMRVADDFENLALWQAMGRANEALRRIQYPNGYTRADRLRDRLAAEDY